MQNHFSFSTLRAAEISGLQPHVLRNHFRRNGHWRGIVPIKLPSGHLRWSSIAVYQALGKLPPPAGRPTPSSLIRDRACRQADIDPFQAHRFTEYLLSGVVVGATSRARLDDMKADLRDLRHIIEAAGRRIGYALVDEQETTPSDWAEFNAQAHRLTDALALAVKPLQWRSE